MYLPEILDNHEALKNKISELFLTATMTDFNVEVKEWRDSMGYHIEIGLDNGKRYLCFAIDILSDRVTSCFVDPDTCTIHSSRNFNNDLYGPIDEMYKKLAII